MPLYNPSAAVLTPGSVTLDMLGTIPAAKANSGAGVSIVSSGAAFTPIPLANEDYDTSGFHDTSVNTSRFTVPAGLAGVYRVGAEVLMPVVTAYAYLTVNSTTDICIFGPSVAGEWFTLTADVKLAVADYVELRVFQNSGSSQSIVTHVWVSWVSKG